MPYVSINGKVFQVLRVYETGGSQCLTLPSVWAKMVPVHPDGNRYLLMDLEGHQLKLEFPQYVMESDNNAADKSYGDDEANRTRDLVSGDRRGR